MANNKPTAVSRFATNNLLQQSAILALDNERLNLLANVNGRKSNFDSVEHIVELYKVIGLNLAMQQLRMVR